MIYLLIYEIFECIKKSLNYLLVMGKIIQNYELKEQLGEGVYAKVYKAVHLHTKQEVAIKVVQAEKFREIPKLQQCTVNQINILSTLQTCPYIVKYIDMLKTANNFYFVYEYCNGGTMDKLMQKQGPFPEKRALFFFRQMIEAFKVLSRSNIMHRDIKPDNILIHNGNIKIADFGFCKPLENQNDMVQTMLGSPIYMAPEVIKGEVYTNKADIWSLGVVLYQMIYGKCPFESKSIAKLIQMLEDEEVIIPEYPKISPALEKLLKKILIKDFTNRIEWKEIFEYTITENGDIFPPGVTPTTTTFGLRASIRNSSGFSSGTLNFSNNNSLVPYNGAQFNNNLPLNESIKGTSALLSPKPGRQSNQDARNYLMKKKSPLKVDQINTGNGNNTSVNFTPGTSYTKNQQFAKNDRSNRLQLLLKNHSKCSTVNQMILDLFRLDQPKSLGVSYFLFKSVEKELNSLSQSLKKETNYNDANQEPFKEFKSAVEKEIEGLKVNLALMLECVQQQGQFKLNQLQSRRADVVRGYLQGVKFSREEQMILILQIVDYLQESILIKKDAYQKLSRQHLLKQLKYKFSKYNIDKDFN